MIRLYLDPWVAGARFPEAAYRLADQVVVSDRSLSEAEVYVIAPPSGLEASPLEEPSEPVAGAPIYSGPSWIAGRWLNLECRRLVSGYRLDVEAVGAYELSGNGERIRGVDPASTEDDLLIERTVLGPVLLLALALQGRWGLHASAAANGEAVFGFLGESGVGKSTLAAGLAEVGGWQPVADDLLPIRLPPSGPRILPRYPQLKVVEQWALQLPEAMSLAALYELRPADSSSTRIGIEPLGARHAAARIARFTFVKFLFDKELLGSHLSFCVELAGTVPVYRLTYPRRLDVIPEIGERILVENVFEGCRGQVAGETS